MMKSYFDKTSEMANGKMMSRLLLVVCLALPQAAFSALSVITTTTDLNAIVQEVGGIDLKSESISKGSQDPHYIEPKPSYMMKASRADLLVAVGMELELGWLPSIIQGARNPKIVKGQPGYLEVGTVVEPLDVPQGKVSRAQGDVHPEGNPHVTLDPIRVGAIAVAIGERLAQLDGAHAEAYKTRALALKNRMEEKTKKWQERINGSGVRKIITFHKTLTYFLNRFQIENPAILEPLPGVPPTAKHTLEVIELSKQQKVPLILVENFFDPAVAERIAKDVPALQVHKVPVAVDGDPLIKSIDDLFENLVKVIEAGVLANKKDAQVKHG